MTLTKRQKIMAALCAVALAILVVDRLQLGSEQFGPETARASYVPVDNTPAEGETIAELPAATFLSRSRSELASRLETMASQHDPASAPMRDMFQPSEAWLERLGARNSKPAIVAPPLEASFIEVHKLQAVLLGRNGSSAIVNNTYLEIGQELDGFELISIDTNSASFARGKVRIVLTLGATASATQLR